MLVLPWVISGISLSVFYLPTPLTFVRSLGAYIPTEKLIGRLIFHVFLFVSSFILIVCINIYLYIQINKSKKKLEENIRTYGSDGSNEQNKNGQLKSKYDKLQEQARITFSLLILGGVDGIINLITIIVVIVMNRFFSISLALYGIQLVAYPLICVQLMSHSLLYGVYMKDIRRRLCKCYLYQRWKRALPLRPSKVIVLKK